jgi:hypothetical protein
LPWAIVYLAVVAYRSAAMYLILCVAIMSIMRVNRFIIIGAEKIIPFMFKIHQNGKRDAKKLSEDFLGNYPQYQQLVFDLSLDLSTTIPSFI